MKSLLVILSLCSCAIPYQLCFGQSKVQMDLDYIVHISEINFFNQVKFLPAGEFIDITYWENGCGPGGPYRRNLRFERDTSFYTILFCDLKRSMHSDELWPIIEEFSKSFLIMDPRLGCTTTRKLVIHDQYAFYLGMDSSCKWMGFTTLIKSIFNILPYEQVDKTCLRDE